MKYILDYFFWPYCTLVLYEGWINTYTFANQHLHFYQSFFFKHTYLYTYFTMQSVSTFAVQYLRPYQLLANPAQSRGCACVRLFQDNHWHFSLLRKCPPQRAVLFIKTSVSVFARQHVPQHKNIPSDCFKYSAWWELAAAFASGHDTIRDQTFNRWARLQTQSVETLPTVNLSKTGTVCAKTDKQRLWILRDFQTKSLKTALAAPTKKWTCRLIKWRALPFLPGFSPWKTGLNFPTATARHPGGLSSPLRPVVRNAGRHTSVSHVTHYP